ncbi:MAG: hypothetical protein IKT51_01205 [Phascolarctobacterium sp.]|nr:hypothetical protein [Phascolarctobacterium sp.]MBR6510849.1 hypothetical protein [Phascolarctobacterium sp.]
MGKILLIMFIFGTLLVSACGSVQNDRNKVVQVDDKKSEASEIRTETLAKLQELKKQSVETYLNADKNAQIVELRGKEMAQLKSYRLQIEQEAEVQIATSKKQLEDKYQLKMFNLQIQLETLKMSFKNRENLLNEIEKLRLERDAKLAILEKEKQNYVNEKMKAYKVDVQQHLDVATTKLL